MTRAKTPKEALWKAIAVADRMASIRSQADVPGAVIERMSPEDRALLEQLTSNDAADVRAEWCPGEPPSGSPAWKQKGWEHTLRAILEGRYR